METPNPPLTLLTLAPMIDSELCRLFLGQTGLRFRERDQMILSGSLLSLIHGGGGAMPLVYGPGLAAKGPRALVERFDEGRLLPDDPAVRAQIEADWTAFNLGLGTDVAVFAYFHMLPQRRAMIAIFRHGVPAWQSAIMPLIYPLMRLLFSAKLKLSAENAADALTRIRACFQTTGARLADGRRYLLGDTLTLADLAFAASAAPLVLPPAYRAPGPSLDQMPEPLRAVATELSAHPCASHVARVYAEVAPRIAAAQR